MCPECGTSISDKARTCAYCGFSSEDPTRPISEQDTYEQEPVFKVEIERWDPEREAVTAELVDASPNSNRQLMRTLGNWEYMQTTFPAFAELVKKMAAGEPETIWVAKIPDYYKKLLDEGTLRLVPDKNGEYLPTLYGERGAVKNVRLEEMGIPSDMTSSLQHLETQAALAQILAEMKNIGMEIEQLQLDMQNDRLAMADSALDKLAQAHAITDSRRRDSYIMMAISSATDAKRILMRNFTTKRKDIEAQSDQPIRKKVRNKQHGKDSSSKASDALKDLVAITNSVYVESEGHIMLGNMEASKESLSEFARFITDNKLTDRDTLLRINMNLNHSNKLTGIADQFHDIAQRAINLEMIDDEKAVPRALLKAYTPQILETDNDDEKGHNDVEAIEEKESEAD
jgi:hypothetical protein